MSSRRFEGIGIQGFLGFDEFGVRNYLSFAFPGTYLSRELGLLSGGKHAITVISS
jgi:hypothetical protein